MNNFLVALLLLLLCCCASASYAAAPSGTAAAASPASKRPSLRTTALAALVSGLALCNQHTSVIYVVVSAPTVVWWGRRRLIGVWPLFVLSVMAVLGLSSYVYVPLAAWHQPLDSWGDQRSMRGFLTHFLREEYGTFQLASDLGEEQDFEKILNRLKVPMPTPHHRSLPSLPSLPTVPTCSRGL